MSAYARRAVAERQRQNQIKNILSGNNHTLIQMNSAEFVDYIISVKMKQGKSRSEVVDWLDELLEEHNSLSSKWKRIKDQLKTGGGLYPLFDDVKALAIIAVAMQRQGNVFGKFKIKVYNGSPAIIMSSYPGIKAHLTGTRYLASNPKLFTIGVGKLEAAKAMKGGFVLTLVISVTFHATDYLLNDQKTWHDLVAGVAVDMAVVGAAIVTTSTILGVASSASAGLATIIAGTVLVPLLVVVVVGVAFSIAFSDTSGYVKVLSEELRNIENKIQSDVVKIRAGAQKINNEYKENPNEFLHEFFGVPMFKKNRSYNF
ncbi:hypothetical protein [Pseudoalteromonas agarivorans]|jgi:hypothetical protein|uniref:Uncharacterized protein n=1 Tax=Pseudoalteromonas agarivorans DSM 14585 TaxID=1312369 RepID=A0ACA8E0I6_9GAMM|nr:hypothetical protein [Pseudoalteromonas agarivorans]ATC83965.1 hypothetical protein PAGA_a3900 [Pseudoalteromonas agarivorans DSM 14585]